MSIPAHVAIIMDGNGRWASRRRKPRHAGHQAGVQAIRTTIEACIQRGVRALTLFAFSSENWRRPGDEVSKLMDLFVSSLNTEVRKLHDNGVKLCFIGERGAFSKKLQKGMADAECLTGGNDRLVATVAVNYGGRWEILEATKGVAADVIAGRLQLDKLDESTFQAHLALGDLPPPDLFIRTGGETRLSNFLLWHLAYTELYFTDTLWPDFDAQAFDAALEDFAVRERRFGGVVSGA